LTWSAGRRLVKVPFLSMVNLIAERQIVPEFIQHEMTSSHITSAAEALLNSAERADRMRVELGRVRALLTREGNPFERAASLIDMDLHARVSGFNIPQETIK
jgi:lipid-A-disaccharide synthase